MRPFRRSKAKASSTGFTLVELLVVIAIITVLASLLLPAMGNARKRAEAATCMSNLKQIASAALLYTADNEGYLPIGHKTKSNWPAKLPPYLNTIESAKVASIMTCPAQARLFERYRSYSMNERINSENQGRPLRGPNDRSITMAVMTRPGDPNPFFWPTKASTIAFFMDGRWNRGSWGHARTWGDIGNKGFPHNLVCNTAFLDGHVEPVRKGEGIWGRGSPQAKGRPKFKDGKLAF